MASASARGNQIDYVRGASYPIAFANWNGGIDGERNGNKMLTGAYQNLTIQ